MWLGKWVGVYGSRVAGGRCVEWEPEQNEWTTVATCSGVAVAECRRLQVVRVVA